MNLADAVAVVMFTAVTLYAIFAGADFGSGIWDLTAGDADKGAPTRRLIDHAVGPVWEANHVWLIFVLVFLWTGFPQPFTSLTETLAIPLWLAALGIVARGAGFAFRKYSPTLDWARRAGAIFAGASLVTPFFLGTIAGAVASGRVPADGQAGLWTPWLNPTSILGGVLAVATCTFLAGVFLATEAETLGHSDLANDLRHKSLLAGMATGAVVVAGIPIVSIDDETLTDGLMGRALPLVLVSGMAGTAAIVLLHRHRLRQARAAAVVAVATVVVGWGVAQYPWILVDEVRIDDGAGARAALVGLLVASGVAAVLVVPPLVYLFRLADTNRVGSEPAALSSPQPGSCAAPGGSRTSPPGWSGCPGAPSADPGPERRQSRDR